MNPRKGEANAVGFVALVILLDWALKPSIDRRRLAGVSRSMHKAAKDTAALLDTDQLLGYPPGTSTDRRLHPRRIHLRMDDVGIQCAMGECNVIGVRRSLVLDLLHSENGNFTLAALQDAVQDHLAGKWHGITP
jgi:hypothetical protein